MQFSMTIPQIIALLVATAGALADLKTRKIPNKLTFPAAALGILTQAVYYYSQSRTSSPFVDALAGAATGVLGWIAAVFVMSVIKFFLKQMGHGDTKLMAAIGSFVGPKTIFIVIIFYAFTFGLFGLARMMWAAPWKQLNTAYMAQNKELLDLKEFDKVRKEAIPVAPFIAIGTVLGILLEEPMLRFMGFIR